MRNRRSLVWSLVVVVALVVAGCGDDTADTTTTAAETPLSPDTTTDEVTDTTTGEPGEALTVRAAVTGDEGTINPYTYVTGFPGWNLLMMQYDSIMQFDADGIPQPWLAESVTPNEDLTEFEIVLSEGVTWHDGEPLTAEDVQFAYQYFIDNATGRFSRDLAGVESITVDGDTITIGLSAPNPAFDLVALADVPIIPQHVWEGIENPGEATYEIATNVGSGPFQLVEYTPDQSYRFVANSDYFLGAPPIDELVVVVFASDAGANAAIRSGEVDVIFNRITPEQISSLDGQGGLEVVQGPEFTTQMINFDTARAPFDDVTVRQAMSMAIDRQDLVDTVYLGSATLGSPGWVHPGKDVYNPDVAPVYDVNAANILLEDAGYTDTDGDGVREFGGEPMSFELLVPSGDSLRLRLAELSSEMLAEIGIQANVASVEQATWEDAVWPGFDIANGRNYELAMWGWSAPVQANTIRVADLVHSDQGVGFLNLTGFENDQVDDVSSQLLVEGDPGAAATLIAELQQLIADELPFLMLAYPDGAYVYDTDVYSDWVFIAGQGIVNKLSLLPPQARP